jgi:hypothetical protein
MHWFLAFGSSFGEDTQRLGVLTLLLGAVIGTVKIGAWLLDRHRERAIRRRYALMAANSDPRKW